MSTPLSHIVETVEGYGQTLTLYNLTVSQEELAPLLAHFEGSTVTVRQHQTSDVHPEDFAVLHDGATFIAASGVPELCRALDTDGPYMEMESPHADYPDLLNEVNQSVFTEYGKRRMILASRDVEKRAWRARPTELHVGFQEFSRFRTQLELYRQLTEEVTVHLYGVPDWDPPLDNVRLHGYRTDELRDHWFVLYRATTGTRAPGSRMILAQEREPNTYWGFWSSHRSIAERTLDRLQAEYPVNEPFA